MLKRVLLMMLSMMLCQSVIPVAHAENAAQELPNPKDLPAIDGFPQLMTFQDGTPVQTPEDWARRREELLKLYSHYMYGCMPDPAGETLTYALADDPDTGEKLLTITVTVGETSADFSVLVTLPEGEKPEGGFPYFIDYTPYHYQSWFTHQWVTEVSANCRYAASRGYAGINYDCSAVAQDNRNFSGAFYTLYPYKLLDQQSRNGTLLAWAWGVSKIIDAMEQGAGAELGIDPALSLVGGVSRYGKSVAVAGAYDERIKVVIPSCSGAGGLGMLRYSCEGKTFDLSSLGYKNADGTGLWKNGTCESFGNMRAKKPRRMDEGMLPEYSTGGDGLDYDM